MKATATSRDPAAHIFMRNRMARLFALAAVLLLAGCAATPARLTDAGDGKHASACYPVWYATNRKPLAPTDFNQEFGDGTDDAVHYGRAVLSLQSTSAPHGSGAQECAQIAAATPSNGQGNGGGYTDPNAWEQDLRDALARVDPVDRDIVVFVHGFANSFGQTAELAAHLGSELQVKGAMAIFSWPSRDKHDPFDYLADLSAVENSEEELGDFLARVGRIAGPGRVHVIAHSLGVYGFLRALHTAAARAQILDPQMHFGQVILAAPDIDERLFWRLAALVPAISDRTTLYVADQDIAVKVSEFIHGDHRMGLLPPVPLIDAIDTIEVLGRSSAIELGHSYFHDAPDVLTDIRTLIHFGESPLQRARRNGFPVADKPSHDGAWIIRNRG